MALTCRAIHFELENGSGLRVWPFLFEGVPVHGLTASKRRRLLTSEHDEVSWFGSPHGRQRNAAIQRHQPAAVFYRQRQ